MIGNKLELSIIGIFQKDLKVTHSIHEISKLLRKSYPNINKKSNYLLKEEILKKIVVGNSYQCFLNMNSEKARIFLAVNELNKQDYYLAKNPAVKEMLEKLEPLPNSSAIKTVLLEKDRMIIVSDGDVQSLKKSIHSMIQYSTVFQTTAEFTEHLLHVSGADLIVGLHVHAYVQIIADVGQKLIMQGFKNKIEHQLS